MLENTGECPPVDEAFYYGFCGGGKKKQQQKVDLSSHSARREFIEALGKSS
jgi:hypothetical protein